MANDPGWGNRNNEGPPDLDEVMRQFSRKLKSFFGKSPQISGEPEDKPSVAILPVFGLISRSCFGNLSIPPSKSSFKYNEPHIFSTVVVYT